MNRRSRRSGWWCLGLWLGFFEIGVNIAGPLPLLGAVLEQLRVGSHAAFVMPTVERCAIDWAERFAIFALEKPLFGGGRLQGGCWFRYFWFGSR